GVLADGRLPRALVRRALGLPATRAHSAAVRGRHRANRRRDPICPPRDRPPLQGEARAASEGPRRLRRRAAAARGGATTLARERDLPRAPRPPVDRAAPLLRKPQGSLRSNNSGAGGLAGRSTSR